MIPERPSAAVLLKRDDALSEEACRGLLNYREEDHLVDFKETFDPSSGKAWIDLAIDCVSFANTEGGYLVIGVADRTWNKSGLPSDVAAALADTKIVLEKINRCLAPQLTRVRSRRIEEDGKHFIVIYSPPSIDVTHIFESNLDWQPQSGGRVLQVVQKGAIYIRRAASNQIMTSVDFELLVARRINSFREKILEGPVRVVNAPPDHEVVTIEQSQDADGAKSIVVTDGPDSLGLRGKPLKLASNAIEDRLKLYQALTTADANAEVPLAVIYEAYANRDELRVTESMASWLAYHSLRTGAPPFFWLGFLKTTLAREVIKRAFNAGGWRREYVLTYSGFYGQRFYEGLAENLAQSGFPRRSFPGKLQLLRAGPTKMRERDVARATDLARTLMSRRDRFVDSELEKLDCSLYASFD